MCGIAGLWDPDEHLEADALPSFAHDMAKTLVHRGPDDEGVYVEAEAGLALVHLRLSILDLSHAGHQPMKSSCGRFVIVFNGEIYNHLDLRRELERSGQANSWRGHADTETLLAAISAWGLAVTLQRSVGMFAFALWDKRTRTLTLGRDRLGEKPLYYGWQGSVFMFGSELTAIRANRSFRADINRDAITLLLRHNCIPVPYSIYCGIQKLPPGTYINITEQARESMPLPYWSAREVAEQGQRDQFSGSDVDAEEALHDVLSKSVAGQMISDVPLGAFLSGGIDSSIVAALMQAQSSRPVRTFSIGSWDRRFNEAEHAKMIASHLGTEHTELYVTPENALDVVPSLPALYDEPFSDSSQIPTFLVAQLARQHVTVALSGDGGDEMFGGYNRHVWTKRVWNKARWAPRPLRAALAGALTVLSPEAWNIAFKGLEQLLPQAWRYSNPGDKLYKLAEVLSAQSPEEIYWRLVSHWKEPQSLLHNAHEPTTVLTDHSQKPEFIDFENMMMYLDQMSYLPDDILVKVDRAAMGVSLETRMPFLDHRVVELAWKLPLTMKIRNGQGKWLLRQVLDKYIPRRMIERPKMGFGVPLDDWLRGPLREWAESQLSERRLQQEGFFVVRPVRKIWQEHLTGRRNWAYHLWDILMFQAWLEATH